MLAVGIEVESQAGFATGIDGNVALFACRDRTNRLRESRAGGDDVGKFDGRAIDDVKVCSTSAAGEHCCKKNNEDGDGLS